MKCTWTSKRPGRPSSFTNAGTSPSSSPTAKSSSHTFQAPAKHSLVLAIGLFLAQCPALIVLLLAPSQSDLDLGFTVLEIQAQRDNGQALGLRALVQTSNLMAVQ